MARKKRTRKTRKGKRRIGAAGGSKDFLMEAAGATAVVTYGGKLTSLIPATVNAKIVGAVEGVAGFIIAKKSRNPFVRGAAIGLFAMGVNTLLKSFGIAGAPGMGYQGPVDFRRIAAPGNYPALQSVGDAHSDMMAGFTPEMSTVSGVDEFEEEEYLD